MAGWQRQMCGSQPPFCPIYELQSSFNWVKTLVLRPPPGGGWDTWTGAQRSFKEQPQWLQIRSRQVGLCPCNSYGDPTIPP